MILSVFCFLSTVMILSFWTDRPGQTVQTQIRLLLRSSLIRVDPVCNSICIFWMHYSKVKPSCSTFRVITANFQVSEILGFFTVLSAEINCYSLITRMKENQLYLNLIEFLYELFGFRSWNFCDHIRSGWFLLGHSRLCTVETFSCKQKQFTITILSNGLDRPRQLVKTKISLISLHCFSEIDKEGISW